MEMDLTTTIRRHGSAELHHRHPYHFSQGQTMNGKRRYERVAFYCPVQLTVLPDGPDVPGNTFDISLAGMGLAAEVFLERGQDVLVRFHPAKGSPPDKDESVLGRVAYSRADEGGNRLGIEFVKPIRESTQPSLTRRLFNL